MGWVDLLGNHIVGFPMTWLIPWPFLSRCCVVWPQVAFALFRLLGHFVALNIKLNF